MVVEIDEPTRQQLLHILGGLDQEVTIHLFTEGTECLFCNDTSDLVNKVSALSEKIRVVPHQGPQKKGKNPFGVQRTPAIVMHGAKEYKVKFYGIPVGHEFGAFVTGIVDVSTGASALAPDIAEDIKAIAKPINVKVFTTPQCPYCPQMVRLTWQAAILNPLIEGEVYESLEFQDLVTRYEVFGTPKTVINEKFVLEGLAPPGMFVDKLYEAIGGSTA
ncbi:MAG: glutaredoxin [Candidatus Thorarchaeota archaeon]|nr:MAG: glutaredoxin [Candidatus Thorarchaeota archaeon]